MPKLRSQGLVVIQRADSAPPPPPTPTPPEGQVQVTFRPPGYNKTPQSDVEEEEEENEEQLLKETAEAVHLNNASYFFLHRD